MKQVLKKNNFDAFLCSENVAKSLINENFTEEEKSKFDFSKENVFSKEVYLMVSKNHKGYKKILDDFNKGLKYLNENNLIKKIVNGKY